MKKITDFELHSDARKWLDSLGITGPAADALLKESASLRHEVRVKAARNTAVDLARESFEHFDHDDDIINLLADLLLILDMVGVGGLLDVGGYATDRLPGFGQLGKGRKQATDGPAWTSAILDAIKGYCGYGHYPVIFGTDCGLGISAGKPGFAIEVIVLYEDIPDEMLRWFRTLAREGLRRAAGLSPWFPAVVFRQEADPAAWAALVNLIEARITGLEIETAVGEPVNFVPFRGLVPLGRQIRLPEFTP